MESFQLTHKVLAQLIIVYLLPHDAASGRKHSVYPCSETFHRAHFFTSDRTFPGDNNHAKNTAKKLTKAYNNYLMTSFTSLSDLLLCKTHIDLMTDKWLTTGLKQPRIPEFYTLTEIHKKTPVGRTIVSGSGGPTDRISSFVDSLLQPVSIKQESYIKDTTDFINFIENMQIPDNVVLATLDVSSLHTNTPQEEGFDVVCHYYEDHYQQKLPIPTSDLQELMQLILEENSFKFSEKTFRTNSRHCYGN